MSFAPGSSTSILPDVPNLWILGCVTPNLSTLFLRTSKAEIIDSSIFLPIIFFISLSEVSNEISLKVLLPNISGDESFVWSVSKSNASKKDSKYVSSDCFWSSSALSRAWLNFILAEFSDKPLSKSLIAVSYTHLTLPTICSV